MKVKNFLKYDVQMIVQGKHYVFKSGEVREVPDYFRGLHTNCLADVTNVKPVVQPKPLPEKKEEVKDVIRLKEKHTEDSDNDKPIFSNEIDSKIKENIEKQKVQKKSVKKKVKKVEKKSKPKKSRKSKISKEKRLEIRKKLLADKQSRR